MKKNNSGAKSLKKNELENVWKGKVVVLFQVLSVALPEVNEESLEYLSWPLLLGGLTCNPSLNKWPTAPNL